MVKKMNQTLKCPELCDYFTYLFDIVSAQGLLIIYSEQFEAANK